MPESQRGSQKLGLLAREHPTERKKVHERTLAKHFRTQRRQFLGQRFRTINNRRGHEP